MDENHSRQLALGILLDNIIQGFEEAIRTGNSANLVGLDRAKLVSSLADAGNEADKKGSKSEAKAPAKPAKVFETVYVSDDETVEAEIQQEKTKGGRTRSFIELDGERCLVTKGKGGWRLRAKAKRDFSDFVAEGVDRQILDALYVKNEGGVNPEWNELADAAGVSTGVLLASFRKLKGAGLAESNKDVNPSVYMLTEAGREQFESRGSAPAAKASSPKKRSPRKSSSRTRKKKS